MKQVSKFFGPVAMAMAALWAPHASATNFGIVNSNGINNNTYMGSYNPGTNDRVTMNQDGPLQGSFLDYWVFDLSPDGNVEINMTFNPSSRIRCCAIPGLRGGPSPRRCARWSLAPWR